MRYGDLLFDMNSICSDRWITESVSYEAYKVYEFNAINLRRPPNFATASTPRPCFLAAIPGKQSEKAFGVGREMDRD